MKRLVRSATFAATCVALGGGVFAASPGSLTVCADPGNMPLSDQNGAGFENKIAEVIGKAAGVSIHYYWRPSIERGLMRTTLSEGNCDLWMDMATDTEGAVVLKPLYRSTFVLAYRNDKGIDIRSLDDPALKKLRIGVFQVSAARMALAEHKVVANTVIHYLSHNADEVAENQPSYQVQQVIDGKLDVAAAWGPMAGYYQKMQKAPLTLLPINRMEDQIPLEFDMALAVPRGRPELRSLIETALEQSKDQIRQILTDYGVPLVQCDTCTVSGDLPAHGPYKPLPQEESSQADIARERATKMAQLKKWLAQGADPDAELANAVVANDPDRVHYLLAHGAHVNSQDGEGYTPLINSIRFRFAELATYLANRKADVNLVDRTGWTPLMYAAWNDDAQMVEMLLKHGARLEPTNGDNLTALAIAAQNAKIKSAQALVAGGADVNAPVANGGYTPLMLTAIAGSNELASWLLEHGAQVNARNPGGVTALMIAAASNHPSTVGLLLKAGADPDARSEDGRTALSIAQSNNSDAVVRVLQEAAQRGASKSG
ncbi:MAG TPA: quinoprotein dehydrogenase-associated putative ABC transporter substrate-binding protein [Steroidobacteraceae bacterium]|nr:quinoprotein dehydrogenase-associated putative ABC transporter substrate-binding protein [Steroidobacteraceae bacterium]